MCLLMVAQPGATPSESYLKCACHNNPDGFGYAIHTGDKIVTSRGMNWSIVVDDYYAALEKYPNSWSMFHARLATHGAEVKANCHPFRVGGSERLVLAHNGILPLTLPKHERRSDTKYFAEVILPRWSKRAGHISTILDDEENFAEIGKWAKGNKLAIFSTFRRLKKPVYIVNEELGSWDDGIWWSNSSHKDVYRWHYTETVKSVDGTTQESMFEYECLLCRNFVDSEMERDGYCYTCQACLDCFEEVSNCLCYTPESLARDSIYTQEEFSLNKF
jgi:hypothetical protein